MIDIIDDFFMILNCSHKKFCLPRNDRESILLKEIVVNKPIVRES